MCLFASRGYLATGIRDVAEMAGVNSALVGRYFGTKRELFAAAIDSAVDMRPMLTGDQAKFGERVAAIFVASRDLPSPIAMMLLASADEDARAASVAALQSRVLCPLAEWLGDPPGHGKALRLTMLWQGFLAGWQLLPLANYDEDRLAEIVAWVASATQAIIDEKDDIAPF